MAEETKKTTTARKPKAKPEQKEEVVDMNAMAQQMQQMMQIMAQQQQMIMQLQQNQPSKEEVEEEPTKKKSRVRITEKASKGLTKQGLRRKYKDTDIYLTSVFTGSVAFEGKNDTYVWSNYGDVQSVTIGDLIDMSRYDKYLLTPWLVLDDYENDEELLDDVITCLGLERMYRRLYILQELEDDINAVDMDELSDILKENPELKIDVCVIAQNKIDSEELENYRLISEFEKLIGRTLNKKQ